MKQYIKIYWLASTGGRYCKLAQLHFYIINLVRMFEWTDWQSQSPRQAELVTQALTPTVRSGNSEYRENQKPKFSVPIKAGHGPSHSTVFNWLRLLAPTADHPRQESHVSSAGATRTRALTTGSPMLYQLSYGTD